MTPPTFRAPLNPTTLAEEPFVRFAVTDIAAAEDALAAGEVEAQVESDRLVIAPGTAMGATVVFEEGR